MYRYVALIWRPEVPRQAAEAARLKRICQSQSPTWACVADEDGLAVFHAGAHPPRWSAFHLHRDAGVVLGTLFESAGIEDAVPAPVKLTERASRDITRSGGASLIGSYWGRYVAFVRDAETRFVHVVRDPSEKLQCYVADHQGMKVAFSDLNDCVIGDHIALSVNWRYVAACALQPRLLTSETGLNEVSEIRGGERLTVGAKDVSRSFLWNPHRIARDDAIRDPAQAERVLRRRTRHCVAAWASLYDRLLHSLSGGLDSSIVATCLTPDKVSCEVTALNLFTPTPEGDERDYARRVARHTGLKLLEHETAPATNALAADLPHPRTPNPCPQILIRHEHALQAQIAREARADAYFDGQGGDHIYGAVPSPHLAVDYLRLNGPGPELPRVMLDAAIVTKASFWAIAGRTAAQLVWPRNPLRADASARQVSTLIADAAAASVRQDYGMHPWAASSDGTPPAKLLHVANIAELHQFVEPIGRRAEADVVLPLISQPVLEGSLRVPMYMHHAYGRSRAAVRAAFSADLPSAIINRTAKGAMTRYYTHYVEANLGCIREVILDGALIEQGVIDRANAEELLAGDHFHTTLDRRAVTRCFMLELWLRNALPSRPQCAAA